MKKSKYADCYEKRTTLDENGNVARDQYVYIGDYFCFDKDDKQMLRIKNIILAIALFSFIIYFFSGFIDSGGSRVFYVLLPFVCAFLPIAFMLIAAVQFRFKQDDFTIFEYERIWVRLKFTGIAAIFLLSISILGELLFLCFTYHSIPMFKESVYLLCCLSVVCFNLILLHLHTKTACLKVNGS
ncbi:MAG: hypothetical protein WCN92_08585 [Eubacteriales bacterium]